MSASVGLRALLVDPSLFTAPYDAALTEGLVAAGVAPSWAVRPTRDSDRQEIAAEHIELSFYGRSDRLRLPAGVRALAKGLSHVAGLVRLVRRASRGDADVVHFQWAVVPWLDVLAMLLLRRWCPVLLTAHDTTPFNGERPTAWQAFAFDAPLRCADRVIVHTRSARAELLRRGVPSERLALIPHGPLRLHAEPSEGARQRDGRWTLVLFGELKRYKGLDVLVEALAQLPAALKGSARVIVAGRPRMPLQPIIERIAELGLGGMLELRAARLSEQEMADLFEAADCFLFPYRQVDASGVYFLVKSCSKWIIASDLGIFAEDVVDGVQGRLVPAEDAGALAQAIAQAIEQRPRPAALAPSAAWSAIGQATADLYREALAAREQQARPLLGRWFARRAFSTIAAVSLLALSLTALATGTWLARRALAARAPEAAVTASALGIAPAGQLAPALPTPLAALAPAPLGLSADAGYHLAKNWDFRTLIRDETALRAEFFTRYIYAGGTLDHLNDEWSRYRDSGNHVFVADGLALTARVRGALLPGQIESGMLRSRWSGLYGVYEIRMKPPAGRGLWPAFWLNPQDQVWPPEIDVIEIVDNGRDTPRHGFHFLHGVDEAKTPLFSRLNAARAYVPGIDYSAGFHVFSVEWTPERVRHRVDGTLVVEREFRWLHADGKEAGPAHVLVNLAVGGSWPGPPSPDVLPASLVVDYIRVWQR